MGDLEQIRAVKKEETPKLGVSSKIIAFVCFVFKIDFIGILLKSYKNNNGNSSLGLVPIHRKQPRL
jgi:hypothetical protein